MALIILDFGSGNTCKNDKKIVEQMYDELRKVDTGKNDVVVKWQLFERAGDNIPLDQDVFDYAYRYGIGLGYRTTASVFDFPSLQFLLQYDIPFVKIANRRDLDWLISEVPRKIPVYVSCGSFSEALDMTSRPGVCVLLCVSKYPATRKEYEDTFDMRTTPFYTVFGISDHTVDFALWNTYAPNIIEWHYKLADSTGLDAGPFAKTPEQLQEVL